MIKKISKKFTRNHTQPEIRPGDIWLDSYGKKVTIRAEIPTRVYFDREGYEHICSMPRFQFLESFRPGEGVKSGAYAVSLNPVKALQAIREKINAAKVSKK